MCPLRSRQINLFDTGDIILDDDNISSPEVLILFVDDDSQHSRQEKHDNIRDRQAPRRLDQIAIVRVYPQAALILGDDRSSRGSSGSIRPSEHDALAVRRDVHRGRGVDRDGVALVISDVCRGRDAGDQRAQRHHVPKRDPQRRVVCPQHRDQYAERPREAEQRRDEEAQDAAGYVHAVAVVPRHHRRQDRPRRYQRQQLQRSQEVVGFGCAGGG